jgi:hypothetical protein
LMNLADLDGDWVLLVGDAAGPGDGASYEERFTVRDGLVTLPDGSTAPIRLSASIELPDGRTIALALPGESANGFSATVTTTVQGEDQDHEWSDPANWVRARAQ